MSVSVLLLKHGLTSIDVKKVLPDFHFLSVLITLVLWRSKGSYAITDSRTGERTVHYFSPEELAELSYLIKYLPAIAKANEQRKSMHVLN